MSRKRRGRHEGTVYQRSDGRWEARADIGMSAEGRRLQVSAYGKSKQEALERLAVKRSQPASNRAVRDQRVCDFLADYLRDVGLKNSDSTWLLRKSTITKHVNPQIGGLVVGRITTQHVRDLLHRLKENGASDHTVKRVYVTLHAAFQAAVEREDLGRNPCKGCPKPKARPKARTILELDEAHEFLRAVARHMPQYFALLVVACTTAMRQGEIFGLTWACVSLEKGYVDVLQQLVLDREGRLKLGALKTEGSRRRIPLCELAIVALRNHKQRFSESSELVFTAEGGGPIWKRNFSQRVLDPLIKMAGIRRVVFHELRHTINSLLLEDGVSPIVMKELLGHESLRMTLDTYSHVIPGAKQKAADKASMLFPVSEFDGQMMVREASIASDIPKKNARKPIRRKRFYLVETWGVEPQTSYMRSKRSTS
jgi:integrase